MIVETDAVFMNLYDGKLYYVDGADRGKIYFLDLDSEDMAPEVLELEENIKEAVNRYALVPVSEYNLEGYMGMNFQQNHMAFMCTETINGEQYMDEYIYDFAKDSIMPVAYFFVNREVLEAAMEESTKESKEESADISSMSEYEKVATAHDYLCNTCQFALDWRYNRANTAWGALIHHEAQCSGYSRAMKALCDWESDAIMFMRMTMQSIQAISGMRSALMETGTL